MTRKLRNSLIALSLAASVTAFGAMSMAVVPFASPAALQAASMQESPDARVATAVRPGTFIAKRRSGRSSRLRHASAMPYFSFVPRG